LSEFLKKSPKKKNLKKRLHFFFVSPLSFFFSFFQYSLFYQRRLTRAMRTTPRATKTEAELTVKAALLLLTGPVVDELDVEVEVVLELLD